MFKLTRYVYLHKNAGIWTVTCNFVQRTVVSTNSKDTNTKVSKLKKYWFLRFVDYVRNYDVVLKKNFPRTMQVYSIFSEGTKAFYFDLKKYLSVVKKHTLDGVEYLTSNELQLKYKLQKDIMKISPVLLISAVPFTNYIIFPLAFYFPRHILTSHYWTQQQKLDFLVIDHQRRLRHNMPLFKCLQAEVPNITDKLLLKKWNDVIACLGSGSHPTTEDIIYCSNLFLDKPYGLKNLKRKHLKELLGVYDMSIWRPYRRYRLMERGTLIKQMDTAIIREGRSTEMSQDGLQWALSFRGLNPANLPLKNMEEWLEDWLKVSEFVNKENMSLLLHCPILLAYNHPNNWKTIYK